MSAGKVPVGFVGLGQMGRPMAANLAAKDCEVLAWDASEPARAAATTVAGLRLAASADEVAGAGGVVILMLPDSTIVDALLWDHGFASRLPRGSLVIDMGSSHPMSTRRNAERLERMGVDLVDAPVSGGVRRAIAGTLAIMVGGRKDPVDRAMPLLARMGTTLVHVGASGGGHAVKALNNYVSAAGLAATCEALVAARRFGLDPSVVNQVFNASTGRNNTTENKVEAFMLNGRFDSGFAMSLMRKDLQTALSLMRDVGAGHALAERCVAVWEGAEAALPRGADHTALFRYVNERAANDG